MVRLEKELDDKLVLEKGLVLKCHELQEKLATLEVLARSATTANNSLFTAENFGSKLTPSLDVGSGSQRHKDKTKKSNTPEPGRPTNLSNLLHENININTTKNRKSREELGLAETIR